jgi:hypothetical protein
MPRSAGLKSGFFAVEIECSSAPQNAEDFARAVILTICQASVAPRVGRATYERCLRALNAESTVRLGFRHPGKADAVDLIWRERERYFRDYHASSDKFAFLSTLPWIGPVTRHSLAWRLGILNAAPEAGQRAVA